MKHQHPDVMQSFPATRDSQVTFANYNRPPFNSWSFRNMDSVAHTAMVPRGGELPKLVSNIDATLGQRKIMDARGTERTLDNLLEAHNADGFLVLRDNQILYENYFNGLGAQPAYLVLHDQVPGQHRFWGVTGVL